MHLTHGNMNKIGPFYCNLSQIEAFSASKSYNPGIKLQSQTIFSLKRLVGAFF